MTLSPEEIARKKQWRARLLAARAEKAESTRAAEDTALRDSVLEHITRSGAVTVGAYVPTGSEPGSPDLLDGLRTRGCRVLLPIVTGAQPLEWAEYTGPDSLRSARYGLLEPAGTRLGPAALGEADIVLVPALAVDHQGVRLGRGGGHYDRSLPLASARAQLIALVGEHELVAQLPGEEHDVRMNAVITPERGAVALPL
ncbi:5-formyltetrahydrofolate cyclo-ligase [Halopolyspora algeriensis]|uniref:5-formyltetrahydrofolate cyclo-ligase n=1 Tax=Halopolyspora algeriensis TaxID=1500506 RepID=A0A368VQ78_9ACTN|nr:5-formyltetrahydrofolate cyclo-ligase [Halopolyspora algeriensis]RCW43700.1 5-formyltetrahydrofolate cyclo-ligase [Halopolyspora algeriensis]TQM47517.1 5-formyltetrahydrofolate cyclo-ligase [Halopolyspora algeriensis]